MATGLGDELRTCGSLAVEAALVDGSDLVGCRSTGPNVLTEFRDNLPSSWLRGNAHTRAWKKKPTLTYHRISTEIVKRLRVER